MKVISDEYQNLLMQEHKEANEQWGTTAQRMIPRIMSFVKRTPHKTILDYGAAHGGFRKNLRDSEYTVIDYEPGRKDACAPPEPCEFVICVDVLEHVEPDCIDAVLDDLQRVVLDKAYFQVATRPAIKILKDGRNAHLIIEPYDWWHPKILERFNVLERHVTPRQFEVYLEAK